LEYWGQHPITPLLQNPGSPAFQEPEKGLMMQEQSIKPKKLTFFRKLNRRLGSIVNAVEVSILVFCVASLAVLLIVNVFARTFFQSIYFAEEVSKFLVMLTTFTGVSYGVRKARHIRMGAFLDAMPPKMEKIFLIIICFVSAFVMAMMTWFSYKYLMNAMQMGHMTPALRVPKWTFYVIIPIGFGLACIQYIRTIIKNLTEKDPWQSPDQQSEYEDEQIGGAAL
jgi:C4-dicarboxylate transporter, DctQ subunit